MAADEASKRVVIALYLETIDAIMECIKIDGCGASGHLKLVHDHVSEFSCFFAN